MHGYKESGLCWGFLMGNSFSILAMGSKDNPQLTLFKVNLMTSAMQCPPFFASLINPSHRRASPTDTGTAPQTCRALQQQAQPMQQFQTFSGGCGTSSTRSSFGMRPLSLGKLPAAETGGCTLVLDPGRVFPFVANLCFSWSVFLVFLWSRMLSLLSKRLPENLEIGSWGLKIKKVNTATARRIWNTDLTRANMNLFLTLTLLYDRICFTEYKTGTLQQTYKDFFYHYFSGHVLPSRLGLKLWEQGEDWDLYSLSLARTSTCNTHISICA